MYGSEQTQTTSSTEPAGSYGPSPGKTTLTSRLPPGAGPATGTPPAPPALLARAGELVRDGGFSVSIEPDGSFEILAAPPGQELLIGRRIPPGSTSGPLAQAWQALAGRALAGDGGELAPALGGLDGAASDGGAVGIEPWLAGGAPPARASAGGPAPGADGPSPGGEAGAPAATGPGAASPAAAPTPEEEAQQLRVLLRQPVLTADQIDWCRQVIARQPAELQGDYYAQLQRKSPYANERDNEAKQRDGSKMEKSTGNMCNLTSLAMCLQSLGIAKPVDVSPPAGVDAASLQYEDALFYLWRKLGSPTGNIVDFAAWTPICTALGATGQNQGALAGSRADWEAKIRDAHLRAGHAVMAGGWGHVVRIQDVTEAGVVVDDPYGQSSGKKERGVNNSRSGAEGSARGNDCSWPWPEDGIIALPWYFTVTR